MDFIRLDHDLSFKSRLQANRAQTLSFIVNSTIRQKYKQGPLTERAVCRLGRRSRFESLVCPIQRTK